jgi:large subunit ribosomal protein L23
MSKEIYYNTIISPAITEKSTMVSASNTIVFNVSPNATKPQIKAAVEGLFGVKVKAVNTLVRKGKKRSFKGRTVLLSDKKKAYVTLVEGERLDVTTGL